MHGNTFTCGLRASVAVSALADPLVETNVIEASRGTGVFIFDRGKGTIRDNQFRECRLAAIEIRDEGSDPVVQDNRMSQCQDAGVVVHKQGRATIRGARQHPIAQSESFRWQPAAVPCENG